MEGVFEDSVYAIEVNGGGAGEGVFAMECQQSIHGYCVLWGVRQSRGWSQHLATRIVERCASHLVQVGRVSVHRRVPYQAKLI
ncbi:hypothetical protein GOP47_0002459 [Adiantum capillus-veneris]|uniref:Uncharacterized protein n=1 Tax=Adiantum capillus-veneris TaxID=13818 RepID=A0A9D4VBM3_ADICA|nr:hypothetical protein GOP47_0002459 [Adiantum capillus-veneris]